jgi:hypothetical protein
VEGRCHGRRAPCCAKKRGEGREDGSRAITLGGDVTELKVWAETERVTRTGQGSLPFTEPGLHGLIGPDIDLFQF